MARIAPDLKDFQRMAQEVTGVVQQDVAEASADHDADRHPDEQVIGQGGRKR
jgi:hypothetical protein